MDQSSGFDQMPSTIGRYEVQGAIGFGAMGAVYKAFDPRIKRSLAIKTIRLDIPRQSPEYKTFIERFYHEARISGTLSHPNIVTLYDIGEERAVPYLVMEYVEGETIASRLDAGQRFAPERVIALVSQIASAIDYAHSKGVVHRDIKPSNLILFDEERVKVTDFGIAKMTGTEMTQQGQMLGTPSYMSPEQAMGEAVDGRTDIFSLGVCAFEMLSGTQPFPGNNVTAILYKLVHVDPIEPPDLELRGLVPQKWHEVFRRVLAKKPDDRYQTAAQFVRDLEYCLGSWFGAAMGDDAALGEATLAQPAAPDPDATFTLNRAPAASAAPTDRTLPATTTLPPNARVGTETRGGAAAPAETSGPTVMLPRATPSPTTVAPNGEGETVQLPPVGRPALAEGATVVLPAAGVTAPTPAAAQPGDLGVTSTAGASAVPEVTLRAPAPAEPVVTERMPTLRPAGSPSPRTPSQARPAGPPARPSGSKGLLVALGLLGFVALLVVAGLLVWRARTPVETPSPSPEASLAPTPSPSAPASAVPERLGRLRVESDPVGAAVSLNGEPRGVTPLDIEALPPGNYIVELSLRGYQPSTQTIVVTADGAPAQAKGVLQRLAPAVASLTVLSTPLGAAVSIDGVPAGLTPLVNQRLRPGTHRVDVQKAGFEPWTSNLTARGGEPIKVDATLRPLAQPSAAPTSAATAAPLDPNHVYANAMSEVDTIARKLGGDSVTYPERAPRLRKGDVVSVRVAMVVDETGRVSDVKVIESAGRVVDDAVVSAVKTWTYVPAVKRGVKVKVRIEVKQTFLF
jgi:serine/threonine-protein kinase